MAPSKRAFTLLELLVVLAVVMILAGILFPVFAHAKQAGLRAACISNYKQLSAATGLYNSDYDDFYMPVNHQPASEPNSRNDRTWVQLVLPYVRDFSVFRCPADTSERPRPDSTFDQDLVPGDSYSRFYTASLRSNVAYNYLYLSPVVRSGNLWRAAPRSTTDIANPSRTIVYVDSVWSRDEIGRPVGGGNWLVVPPCRYSAEGGQRIDTFVGSTSMNSQVFVPDDRIGWSSEPESRAVYGGAWPWHFGHMTVAYADGSVANLTPGHLASGCEVRENWGGQINSPATYLWDLR
ncbi:MAG TPA: prepilin-type N-terminal cleavage/methylation domain-containing protein [Fimbriimonas sp.]